MPGRAKDRDVRVSGASDRNAAASSEDTDSARLVARFQTGDNGAFEALYMRYFDRVYSYLWLVLRNPVEAEAAAQQVVVRVFETLPAYEQRGKPFRAWLFTIARNHAISQLRRRGETVVEDPDELGRRQDAPDPGSEPLSVLDWISDAELLLFIERLPATQRQILVLRYMLDLSYAQIAEVLGRTPSDVRRLQHRALKFLRERLRAIGREPRRAADPIGWQRRFRQARVLRDRRFALLGR
jgi:RNA polymerase sigma-70 factor (ECF subfamily)